MTPLNPKLLIALHSHSISLSFPLIFVLTKAFYLLLDYENVSFQSICFSVSTLMLALELHLYRITSKKYLICLYPLLRFFWTGCIYGCANDGERFGFFCHAALEFLLQGGFHPVSTLLTNY